MATAVAFSTTVTGRDPNWGDLGGFEALFLSASAAAARSLSLIVVSPEAWISAGSQEDTAGRDRVDEVTKGRRGRITTQRATTREEGAILYLGFLRSLSEGFSCLFCAFIRGFRLGFAAVLRILAARRRCRLQRRRPLAPHRVRRQCPSLLSRRLQDRGHAG